MRALARLWGSPIDRAALLVALALLPAALGLAARRRLSTFEIAGRSMTPTFGPGDYVLIDRAAYRRTAPGPGDVVLARDPRFPERQIVKRVAYREESGALWLVGDNPDESTDSRTYGPVPQSFIAGRVLLRYHRGHY